MNRLISLLHIVVFIGSIAHSFIVYASVQNITLQDVFIEQLKNQKRLAVAVVDRAQFKEQDDIEKAMSNLESVLTIASNNPKYRLSKIEFAVIDLGNLPEETRNELIVAIGGAFKKPVTFVLFDHGNLIDDGKSISEKDLFVKACHVLADIDDEIDDAWGNYIEYALEKRERADLRRAQVAEQKTTEDQPTYFSAGQTVYYSYPFYRGNFIRGIGKRVGFGGNYWPRGHGYGPASNRY